MMHCSPRARSASRTFTTLATAAVLAVAAACSGEQTVTGIQNAGSARVATSVTSTQFTLSSITPDVQCTDSNGAVTTVTGGTLKLSSDGKYSATFATSTTSGGVVSTKSYTENSTFTRSGSTLTFNVPNVGTFTGTLSNGTLTVANIPYCGATHTVVYTQS
jgi:hypothetical protein